MPPASADRCKTVVVFLKQLRVPCGRPAVTFSLSFLSVQKIRECILNMGHANRQFSFTGCSFILGHWLFFLEIVFIAVFGL
jgi:hypothetical protein